MKLKRVKINRNDPKVLKYEEDFRRGYEQLNDEQKKLIRQSDIQNPELLKALNRQSSVLSKLKNFFSEIIFG